MTKDADRKPQSPTPPLLRVPPLRDRRAVGRFLASLIRATARGDVPIELGKTICYMCSQLAAILAGAADDDRLQEIERRLAELSGGQP